MSDDINADRVQAAKKREQRAEFMRAYVIAAVGSLREYTINGKVAPDLKSQATLRAEDARLAWDAIEAEAAK